MPISMGHSLGYKCHPFVYASAPVSLSAGLAASAFSLTVSLHEDGSRRCHLHHDGLRLVLDVFCRSHDDLGTAIVAMVWPSDLHLHGAAPVRHPVSYRNIARGDVADPPPSLHPRHRGAYFPAQQTPFGAQPSASPATVWASRRFEDRNRD